MEVLIRLDTNNGCIDEVINLKLSARATTDEIEQAVMEYLSEAGVPTVDHRGAYFSKIKWVDVGI